MLASGSEWLFASESLIVLSSFYRVSCKTPYLYPFPGGCAFVSVCSWMSTSQLFCNSSNHFEFKFGKNMQNSGSHFTKKKCLILLSMVTL